MWDKLAECTASTIDQFFTWKQTFFGPNPTSPPPFPYAMFVGKGLPTSRPTLHGRGGAGEGGSERILQQSGKKALCPTHFGQNCSSKHRGSTVFRNTLSGRSPGRPLFGHVKLFLYLSNDCESSSIRAIFSQTLQGEQYQFIEATIYPLLLLPESHRN